VQELVERLSLTLNGSTVRNAIMPLRVVCRYSLLREVIATNPCEGLEMPAAGGHRFASSEEGATREQIATVPEADALIAAMPAGPDRAMWATAFYAGLRRGELRGLSCDDIDIENGVIHVRRGWDTRAGAIGTKTESSVRELPILDKLACVLEPYLAAHDGREFAFPGYGRWKRHYGPISPDALLKRSRKTWEAAGLEPIGLHEARHTFASLMIDAGLPIAKVSRRMGHSSISVTERVYYWLVPQAYEQERDVMNAYLEGQCPSP
jgi:integrase